MTIYHKKLLLAHRDWMNRFEMQVAFTGSARQVRHFPGFRLASQRISHELLAKNVERVIERASRDIFGRKSVRAGRKLKYAGVLEGGEQPLWLGGSRMHVHLGIGGLPTEISLTEAAELIDNRWQQSKWGYTDNNLVECYDQQGWVDYMLKYMTVHRGSNFLTNVSLTDGKLNK